MVGSYSFVNNPGKMKKTINILIVEDSIYFNDLLLKALKQKIHKDRKRWNFRFSFLSFTKATDLIARIKSGVFASADSIAFIDYYLGDGINGTYIIKLLKEQSVSSTTVLMSGSKNVREKVPGRVYDYFVFKDTSAPALCCLCLEQYLDNKFFIPLEGY
jgi:hypothetical protein